MTLSTSYCNWHTTTNEANTQYVDYPDVADVSTLYYKAYGLVLLPHTSNMRSTPLVSNDAVDNMALTVYRSHATCL